MHVYIGLYLLLAFTGAVSSRRRSELGLYLWVLFLVLFAGTREWVGCDFGGYLNRFIASVHGSLTDAFLDSERLFAVLTWVVHQLQLDYMWLNVISTILIFWGYTSFARRCEAPIYFLALAFPILILQLGMSGLRQAIALSSVLLALNAFRDGRKIVMALLIVAASQFHSSAIIFLPLVFMIGRKANIWTLIASTIAALPLAVYLSGERLDVYQDRYSSGDVESFGAVFRVALLAITAVFFEIYRDRYEKFYPVDYPLMRVFSIMSFAVVAVYFFSSIAAHRLGFYMMPMHLLMLIRLPTVIQPHKREPILSSLPFIAYALYLMVWLGLSRHANSCYIPYDSYLFDYLG